MGEPPPSYQSYLTITPHQFKIDIEFGRNLVRNLTLTNRSNSLVTFKVKTTSPLRYLFRPTQGYIAPHATMVCKIVMVKMNQYTDLMNLNDKFLLRSTLVEQKVHDLTQYWKELEIQHNPKAHQFMFAEMKISCQLQLPPSSPFVSEDGSENDPPIENGVGRIETVGEDGRWGCPCCNDTDQHLECEDMPIPELRGIYSPDEWRVFTRIIRQIIHRNTFPVLPTFALFFPFCGFCLPCLVKCYHTDRTRALQGFLDAENVRLSQIGLKWHLNTFSKSFRRRRPRPTEWSSKQEIKLTMTWISGVREAYEAAHPDQRQISQEPYPEQLLTPPERLKRKERLAERHHLQKELRRLQFTQVPQGQLSSAQISALSFNRNGSINSSSSSGPPPVYGLDPGPPGGLVPIIQSSFCSGCGASRAGVSGPFCPKCGFKDESFAKG